MVLPDNLVSDSGVNLLTFRNKYNPPNTFIWGVRNVALQAMTAAELPPAAEPPAPEAGHPLFLPYIQSENR